MYRNNGRANDSPMARFATTYPHHLLIPRRRASSYDHIQNTQDVIRRSDVKPPAGAVAKSWAEKEPSVASSDRKKRRKNSMSLSVIRKAASGSAVRRSRI